jgi:hypothetical protein
MYFRRICLAVLAITLFCAGAAADEFYVDVASKGIIYL